MVDELGNEKGESGAGGISVERMEEFFERYCGERVANVAKFYPDERSLIFEFPDLLRYDSALADFLLDDPDSFMLVAKDGAVEVLRRASASSTKKFEDVNVRLVHIPDSATVKIRNIRSRHISKLICIEGLVRQAQEVRPKLVEGAFQCMKCHHVMLIKQDGSRFKEPYICENESCSRKGPFKLIVEQSKFVDTQKLRVEEAPEELRGGEQPQKLSVNVEDDLAGMVTPGDRVRINGITRSYQRKIGMEKLTTFEISMDCISVEMKEQEFEDVEIKPEDEKEIVELSKNPQIYKKIIGSIAPSIYSYDKEKEAIALQLFSGVAKVLPDGSRIRGDIHILLVGDPGTAKSMILRYVTRIAPRGVYTAGRGSTAAGLTASAIRDEEGRWTLEAGALVIADGGVAAVDELDKMREEDRSALHEALEQQTVSIAKAGITATLKSRCSLLGAANPKLGRFDAYESIASQVDLPVGLLSRFDLIFPLQDKPNVADDSAIAKHILRSHHAGELDAAHSPDAYEEMKKIQPEIPTELLRKYIAYSKKNVFPVMEPEAIQKFSEFYIRMRGMWEGANSPMPMTARQLEALVRLGEASARVRLSNKITSEDADRVLELVNYCLEKVAMDKDTHKFDADIISVGISAKQRDRFRIILDAIRKLSGEGGEALKEDILNNVADEGVAKDRAEEALEELKRRGDITEVRTGKFKIV